jgi:phosphatidylserine/phosphatidylglycerophosphate/cardiolipin synthase-like enzyme
MTMNLKPGYLGKPDPEGISLNFGVVDPSEADIAQAEAIFNADWNAQPYSPPADTPLVISPVNSRQKLLAEIQGATRSIHFFAQEFEDTQIVNAMVAAARRGIEVKGLLAPGIAGNTKTGQEVKAAGGQIRILSQPYEHAKATLVDSSLVYIGSINYTATSLDKNRELGILTRQSDIASQMETEFASFWAKGSELP